MIGSTEWQSFALNDRTMMTSRSLPDTLKLAAAAVGIHRLESIRSLTLIRECVEGETYHGYIQSRRTSSDSARKWEWISLDNADSDISQRFQLSDLS